MSADGYLFETLSVTAPLTGLLWWAWIRGWIQHLRSNRCLLSCTTAFLVGPTFMAPFGTWHAYPAWFMIIHLLFGAWLGVLIYCVVPLLIVASLVYVLSSRFA